MWYDCHCVGICRTRWVERVAWIIDTNVILNILGKASWEVWHFKDRALNNDTGFRGTGWEYETPRALIIMVLKL